MAFTQADLDAIRSAIAKGERTVQFSDRAVTYRSIEELREALVIISGELAAAAGRNRQTLAVASKGF